MDVILAPAQCNQLVPVHLPNPKQSSNEPPTKIDIAQLSTQLYYRDEDNLCLYEPMKFHDKFRSWFVGQFLLTDGKFTQMTQVDPLFILLPIIIKFTSDKFRSIHDICASYDEQKPRAASRLETALSPEMRWQSICETRQVDDELFVKYDEIKTLQWLASKHGRVMDAVRKTMKPNVSDATLLSYASDLIDMYLASSLTDKFKAHVKANFITSKKDIHER